MPEYILGVLIRNHVRGANPLFHFETNPVNLFHMILSGSASVFHTLTKIAETVEPVGSARIAAAIVLKNQIISIGINRRKSHPFQKRFGRNDEAIYLHAEIDAIKNSLRHIKPDQLARSHLYIARVKKKNGNFIHGLAKPCQNGCCKAIATFDIKNVFYTTNEQGIYECL